VKDRAATEGDCSSPPEMQEERLRLVEQQDCGVGAVAFRCRRTDGRVLMTLRSAAPTF